jgi:hypothetical protein
LNCPKKCNALLEAVESCLEVSAKRAGKVQKRGKGRPIFYDDPSLPATTVGPKARRFGRGVTDGSFHFDLMPEVHQNTLVTLVKQLERVQNTVLPTHIVSDIKQCVETLGVKGFGDSNSRLALSVVRGIYGAHTDDDLRYSSVILLKKGHVCTLEDEIVAYFCFPRLGLAVPMRPGDVITFNAQEWHMCSSRTNKSDTIYGLAIYLKSRTAGGNDNSLPLTDELEGYCAKKFKIV